MDEREARLGWALVSEPADTVALSFATEVGVVQSYEWLLSSQKVPPISGKMGKLVSQRAEAWRARLNPSEVAGLLARWGTQGHRFLIPSDPEWPLTGRRLVEQAPFGLWFIGNEEILRGLDASAALVGARASTRYGDEVAAQLSHSLSAKGVTTISGGAYGIDAAVHRGALSAAGNTLTVQAGGLDRLYPQMNSQMFEQIKVNGGIISQIAPGRRPSRWRFLDRNRLIAALCPLTVVIEAASRSGALNTARHALELGRELGAVPGPITSEMSKGTNRLLQEGATCITDQNDIMEILGEREILSRPPSCGSLLDDLDERESRVLDAFPKVGSTTCEKLVVVSGIPPIEVSAALGTLEMAGRISRNGKSYRRMQ